MPTEPEPITLAEVVHRAVETCDDGDTAALDDLLARFEDADEPITAVADIEARLDTAMGGPPTDDDDPAFVMARALIIYLAHRRDELDGDAAELLRLAARAEYSGDPPAAVKAWLEHQGVTL